MAADYHHGVRVIEINDGTRPIRTISTGVLGLIATAEDADTAAYPLDTPVLVTDVQAAIAKAGTTGTLAASLDAIADQASPVAVIVRVATGSSTQETTANVIGTTNAAGKFTGMKALLTAQNTLRVKPRILGCPGLDTQPVATELASIAQKLRAFAYVHANGCETKEAATAYRENFSQRELMVIWPEFVGFDVATASTKAAMTIARAMGLRAKLDEEIGWHKTLSNMGVNGVTGMDRDVYWDLQNPATDAGYLNENEVTTLVQHNGYRFWGSRTCSDDPLFAFENYTRTAQILADTIAEAHDWAVDKPMSVTLMKDIMEGVNAKFRELKAQGYIVDGNCWFNATINTKEVLNSGKAYLDYDYTPVPPLENLVFQQRITDRYLVDLAAAIAKS